MGLFVLIEYEEYDEDDVELEEDYSDEDIIFVYYF